MPAGKDLARGAPSAAGVVIARPAAAHSFEQNQHGDETEQGSGKLGGGNAVAQRKPRAINAGGEGLHREIGHGAVIGQRFHQRQCHAGGDRRSRQRNRDTPEALPWIQAERARRLDHAAGTFEKGGSHQQVNVGIQHAGKQHNGAAQRAHLGEPVVILAPAETLAQARLQRPDELEEVGVGIGQYIGRHRHRQQQRPLRDTPPGKVVQGHQPGRAGAHRGNADADTKAEPDRISHILGQDGRHQVAPGLAGAAGKKIGADGEHRQRDHNREREGENGKRQG